MELRDPIGLGEFEYAGLCDTQWEWSWSASGSSARVGNVARALRIRVVSRWEDVA